MDEPLALTDPTLLEPAARANLPPPLPHMIPGDELEDEPAEAGRYAGDGEPVKMPERRSAQRFDALLLGGIGAPQLAWLAVLMYFALRWLS